MWRNNEPSSIAALSTWAKVANMILFELAYRDENRGFVPIATWEKTPEKGWGSRRTPTMTDGSRLFHALEVKRDLVAMAEEAQSLGEPYTEVDFNRMCIEWFRKALNK